MTRNLNLHQIAHNSASPYTATMAAKGWYDHHHGAIADELEVTQHLLGVWLSLATRVESATMVLDMKPPNAPMSSKAKPHAAGKQT